MSTSGGARAEGGPPSPSARAAARRPPGEATAILTRAVAERLRALPSRRPRRGSRRVALGLYIVLLVLPTAVFGGLHWHQLTIDHRSMVAAVPGDARDATRRMQDALESKLQDLLAREEQRPFFEYRPAYFPPGTIGADLAFVPSSLSKGPTPEPILGWFAWRGDDEEKGGPLTVMLGARTGEPGSIRLQADLAAAAAEMRQHVSREWVLSRPLHLRNHRTEHYAVPIVAINLSDEEDIQCLLDALPELRGLQNRTQSVTVSGLHLRYWTARDGTPRVAGLRNVWMDEGKSETVLPDCFANFGRGVTLRQGFFLDPEWLFRGLPAALAQQVLGSTQRFVPAGSGAPEHESDVFRIQPLKALGIEVARGEDEAYGEFQVVVDVRDLEARFRTQTLRLLGVAAMLVVSLATGLVLLLRSVNRELESARRTENFVSAVTHELRTPVAAIKLYGEMLDAGWVDSPERRGEYYRRIVRETSRLETLVERVLEKGQLARGETRAEPGDLNAVIEALAPALTSLAPEGAPDLAFELDPELPPVLLVHEGVRSIVTNLVENARKYAPVAPGGEPILVVTRREGAAVLLEVLDRGPGIPPDERSRIFEAFYRMGDERTRTARGTGLGLHLVALHVAAMGGRVEARGRAGGGTLFRITLQAAPET